MATDTRGWDTSYNQIAAPRCRHSRHRIAEIDRNALNALLTAALTARVGRSSRQVGSRAGFSKRVDSCLGAWESGYQSG